MRIAAVDETDPLTWRRYYSANQTDGSHNATYESSLTVTYNSKPGTATASLDQSPTTAAGTTVTQATAGVNWSGRTDGTWWVHATAKDKAGLWSTTHHRGFNVDTTAPGAPAVTSAAYPSDAWADGAQVTGTFTLPPTAPTPAA
ncbi:MULTISPECIES: hypothetical protein [unclassified Streptomyces]|uniref:hypothetical protein n=1 Tax=unclassified Streptomyces TaxID=2593676 RepID=UPI00224C9727|nr:MULTISPECIES: hypothetical protein [unclassified Streptomyces]MCX4991695.1 hypothetical protein [Streptomyces sp. NBC_00568]MCX5003069.1 hypothetical protein [Streptomyces sp. NBC_00638]